MSDETTLLEYAKTLYEAHLGHAVDACIVAKRYSNGPNGLRPRARRSGISSIIHSYAAIEGLANRLRFDVFENPGSHSYTGTKAESVAVRRLLEVWRDGVKLEDKVAFLLERKGRTLDGKMRGQVQDVREMRNLLAHGWVAHSLAEFVKGDDGVSRLDYTVTDYKKRFGTVKFNPPDQVTFDDAKQALAVALHVFQELLGTYAVVDLIVVYEETEGGKLFEVTGNPKHGAAVLEFVERSA